MDMSGWGRCGRRLHHLLTLPASACPSSKICFSSSLALLARAPSSLRNLSIHSVLFFASRSSFSLCVFSLGVSDRGGARYAEMGSK